MPSISIPPYRIEPSWLIGAASHFVDRVVADCEQIRLPEKETAPGQVCFWRGEALQPPRRKQLWPQLNRPKKTIQQPHANIIDLRCHEPSNWAHFLNNHLPLTFQICDQLNTNIDNVLVILPENVPKFILRLADRCGLNVFVTDDLILGESIVFEVDPWICLRGLRHEWAAGKSARKVLATALSHVNEDSFPSRIFIPRKGTRKIENEREVLKWLQQLGFTSLYAEELDPSYQLAMFRHAEVVVAVHGAALAPLLYAPAEGTVRHLVELLPCGHMTDVYRVISQQMGWKWIGVRGRIKSKYIEPAYDLKKMYTAHSLDSFEVDLESLQMAFKIAGIDC